MSRKRHSEDFPGYHSPLDEKFESFEHAIGEHDHMDAGKYLGYMERESPSQFGSMPAYDDFGDESGLD
jgi:hypothetical protein